MCVGAVALIVSLPRVLGSGAAGAAGAVQTAEPARVAVVDLEQMLEGLQERDVLQSQLDQLISEKEAELAGLRRQLSGLQSELEILVEGSPEFRAKALEIREAQAVAQARSQSINAVVSEETGGMLLTLFGKIRLACEQVATRDGWDLVIVDDSITAVPPQGDAQLSARFINAQQVLFASGTVDITDEVRQYMNTRFAAGAN